ncbi:MULTISPECIES: DUF4032 domain-containing protein [Corallincola]|uniref:DUF4032 domain-containing protein n=3 Tax=Corallincola TaxID=1775176 RepID=A0A368NKX2_9GAMM|nr:MULTISPECIES: DUF4032 domain-containing protein [Corallincola]RCU50523.1 DUF4032 domain-containing protein [Corallincola holothuriorum]TAA48469.1 DUF4032 domain-containing protein [Corallincola spongiicola]TCI01848.1 DUF4032 domain-containing protein [Corallincola luteus]
MRLQQIAPQEYPLDLGLPWDQPLEGWPEHLLVEMARGISRNVVRFIRCRERIYAVKEINEKLAKHEFQFLRDLQEMDAPSVKPVALVTERSGKPNYALVVTHYLDFSQPYRIMMAEQPWHISYDVLIDAMAELFVWLHLQGVFWGDCSLSNTLFRRDAGRLAAYFVDAETAVSYDRISDGQRELDLMIAQTNVAGELMDLEAGFGLPGGVDPIKVTEDILSKYHKLWSEVNQQIEFGAEEQYQVERRIQRLHDLGYDVEEIEFVTSGENDRLRLLTKVVEPGHHIRRLESLVGIKVQANQARRLLHEITRFMHQYNHRREERGKDKVSEMVAAHIWYEEEYLYILDMFPDEYRSRDDDAELYHQLLEHRWYESENRKQDIGMREAVRSFIANVLEKT